MGQTEYHDIAAQTITEPPPSFTVEGIPDWVFSKRKLYLLKGTV
jgi:hypothetical protein